MAGHDDGLLIRATGMFTGERGTRTPDRQSLSTGHFLANHLDRPVPQAPRRLIHTFVDKASTSFVDNNPDAAFLPFREGKIDWLIFSHFS
jgi:hypothetical protein